MVLVVCKTCRNSRLFHVLAAGLVWRGEGAVRDRRSFVSRCRRHQACYRGSLTPGSGLSRIARPPLYSEAPMTDAHRRALGIVAWIGALVGASVLVLTFVMREYSYRFHPALIHALMYPVPAVVVVALLAAVLVAGGLAHGEGQTPPHRGRRRTGTAAAGAAGRGVVVVVGLMTDRAGGIHGPRSPQPRSTSCPISDVVGARPGRSYRRALRALTSCAPRSIIESMCRVFRIVSGIWLIVFLGACQEGPGTRPPAPQDLQSKWETSTSTDPLDDSEIVIAKIKADENQRTEEFIFVARCRAGTRETDAYMVWGGYLVLGDFSNPYRRSVTVRVGTDAARTETWSVSQSGRATFSREPIRLLRELVGEARLILHTDLYMRFLKLTAHGRH